MGLVYGKTVHNSQVVALRHLSRLSDGTLTRAAMKAAGNPATQWVSHDDAMAQLDEHLAALDKHRGPVALEGGGVMGTTYEKDVVAWAKEQAQLLRSGQLSDLDVQHIAEEIEDVGKS